MRSMQRIKRIAPALVLAVLGVAGGYLAGHERGWKVGMDFLRAEVHGGTAMRLEAAASLRLGDAEAALAMLDEAIDHATASVSEGSPYPQLAPETQRLLQRVKIYRVAFPDGSPEAQHVLAEVPLPMDLNDCRPESGLYRLWLSVLANERP